MDGFMEMSMLKKSNYYLVLGVVSLMFVVGCGGSSPEHASPSHAPKEAATDSGNDGIEPAEATSGEETVQDHDSVAEVSADEGKIGVEACDDFVVKFDACREKLPEDQREALANLIDYTIQGWRDSAKDPVGRAGLPEVCRQMTESQRPTMEYFGCEW